MTAGIISRQRWMVVAFFWFAYFLNHADRQVVFSVLPLLRGELGLTNTQLGLLGSSFQWIYAALVPLGGVLGDSWNRKRIILAAILLWSSTTVGSGLATGFALLLAWRALTGAGEALYFPSANSIIADYHGQRTRAFAMGLHQTSGNVGIVVSGALAGFIGQQYGWRAAFVFFGCVGLAAAGLVAAAVHEPERGLAEEDEHVASADGKLMPLGQRLRAIVNPTAIALMLAFVGMNFVNIAYLTWTPTLLYDKFHLNLGNAGFQATFYHQLGAVAGVLLGGTAADRLALRSRVWRPLVQAFGLLLGAPFIFLLGWSTSGLVVYASLGLFGLFRGLYDSNLFASLYEVVPPAARATATGIMLAVAFFGGGSAPIVVGWLSRGLGLGPALSLTSCCYVFCGLTTLLACRFCFGHDAARARSTAKHALGS